MMPALIDINSGPESNKIGVSLNKGRTLALQMSTVEKIHTQGLMATDPHFGDPDDSRPFFKGTREAFARIATTNLPNIKVLFLSMDMSDSYTMAIEERKNIFRIGTKISGERSYEEK